MQLIIPLKLVAELKHNSFSVALETIDKNDCSVAIGVLFVNRVGESCYIGPIYAIPIESDIQLLAVQINW